MNVPARGPRCGAQKMLMTTDSFQIHTRSCTNLSHHLHFDWSAKPRDDLQPPLLIGILFGQMAITSPLPPTSCRGYTMESTVSLSSSSNASLATCGQNQESPCTAFRTMLTHYPGHSQYARLAMPPSHSPLMWLRRYSWRLFDGT